MSTVAFVEKVNSKSGTGRNGKPYTLYSMKLSDKEGNELPGWYQCGFSAPPCKEGDYVKLEATPKGNNFDVVDGTIKVSKNPPAKPAKKGNSGPGGGGGRAAPAPKTSDLFGEIGGYNTEDDIRRMSYSAAREAAIKVTEMLLEHDGLKLVKADSKAGAASRFEVITETVDKLTVEYFYDAASGRKLETVADSGKVDTSADDELPETEEDFEEEPEFVENLDEFEDDDDAFE